MQSDPFFHFELSWGKDQLKQGPKAQGCIKGNFGSQNASEFLQDAKNQTLGRADKLKLVVSLPVTGQAEVIAEQLTEILDQIKQQGSDSVFNFLPLFQFCDIKIQGSSSKVFIEISLNEMFKEQAEGFVSLFEGTYGNLLQHQNNFSLQIQFGNSIGSILEDQNLIMKALQSFNICLHAEMKKEFKTQLAETLKTLIPEQNFGFLAPLTLFKKFFFNTNFSSSNEMPQEIVQLLNQFTGQFNAKTFRKDIRSWSKTLDLKLYDFLRDVSTGNAEAFFCTSIGGIFIQLELAGISKLFCE